MRLHETMVQKLLKVYEVNSGWTEEKKLLTALRSIDISVYTQTDGNKVLVPTEQLQAAVAQFNAVDNRQERIQNMVDEAKKANQR